MEGWGWLVLVMVGVAKAGRPCVDQRRGDCHCDDQVHGVDYRLSCPRIAPPPDGRKQLEVEVTEAEEGRTGGQIVVQCTDGCQKQDLNRYLTGLNLGRIRTVKFSRCPVPNQPFSKLFESMGLSNVTRLILELRSSGPLDFSNLNLTTLQIERGPALDLKASLLRPLSSLRILQIFRLNGLTLEEDALSSLDKLLKLRLIENNLATIHHMQFSNLTSVQEIFLRGNQLRELPEGVFDEMPNIEELDLSKNLLSKLPNKLLERQEKLKNLNLGENHFESLPDGLLAGKTNIVTVRLNDNGCPKNKWGWFKCSPQSTINPFYLSPSVFANSSVQEIILKPFVNITNIPEGLLQGCKDLRVFAVWHSSFTSLPSSLFKDTPNLELLDLSHNALISLQADLLRGLTKVSTLLVRNNKLSSLPATILQDLSNLAYLDFSENCLEILPKNLLENNGRLFEDSSVVTLVDFSGNMLKHFPTDILARKEMSGNLSSIPSEVLSKTSSFGNLIQKIRRVAVKSILYKREREVDYNDLLGFTYLDLSQNSISGDLMDLGDTQGWIMDISKNDISRLGNLPQRAEARILFADNPLFCDCTSSSLQAVLNSSNPWVLPRNLKCAKGSTNGAVGKALKRVPRTTLTCPLMSGCPTPCSCSQGPLVITVDCRKRQLTSLKSLKSLPAVPGFQIHLLADDNQIEELELELEGLQNIAVLSLSGNDLMSLETNKLPDNLQKLFLHDNKLRGLTDKNLQHLTRSGLQLTLDGNPFLCSCASAGLHRFLQKHYQSVVEHFSINLDCGNLTLATRGLFNMKEEDFCHPLPLLPVLVPGLLLLVIALFLLILRIFYRDTMVIWVFSQPWGKIFFSEKDMDKDKLYDAFLSYSHADSEYVESLLLPGLESVGNPMEHQYRCLIHGRDWKVGAMIPDQIMDSVSASRRTVVVLSKDYLKSTWSKLEFQAAHSKTMQENTQRVILLLHGPLPPTDLIDQDLQKYILANTAIHTNDPWFWKKLRYALPRKKSRAKKRLSCAPQGTSATEDKQLYRTQQSADSSKQLIKDRARLDSC